MAILMEMRTSKYLLNKYIPVVINIARTLKNGFTLQLRKAFIRPIGANPLVLATVKRA